MEPARAGARSDRPEPSDPSACRRSHRRAHARRRGRALAATARTMLGGRAPAQVGGRGARRADRARGRAVRGRLIAGSLALVVGASGGGGAAAHGATPEGAPRDAAREAVFRAGAARVPLRVPPGTPLAGYGSFRRRLLVPDLLGRYPHAFWFAPHEGVLDDVAARALVMYAGTTRVTWIALDVVAVDQRFLVRLAERFAASGIRPGTVIVSASHTHSGPGAYLASALFAFAAVDREDAEVREAVLDAIVEAVRRAGARARDARIAAATVDAPAITTSRLGASVDPGLVVLKLTTTTGEPLAGGWDYAIHGTMLGPRNHPPSGDVMGVTTR